MAAQFALHLDHDGIALARAGDFNGEPAIALDSPDFAASVAAMRERIAAETGGTATCLLVLPDSQVLYTEVAASGLDRVADEARVRSALEGQTPYQIEELSVDWQLDSETIRIAAVARETIDEAVAFALANGFAPSGLTAQPRPEHFVGAPRFALPDHYTESDEVAHADATEPGEGHEPVNAGGPQEDPPATDWETSLNANPPDEASGVGELAGEKPVSVPLAVVPESVLEHASSATDEAPQVEAVAALPSELASENGVTAEYVPDTDDDRAAASPDLAPTDEATAEAQDGPEPNTESVEDGAKDAVAFTSIRKRPATTDRVASVPADPVPDVGSARVRPIGSDGAAALTAETLAPVEKASAAHVVPAEGSGNRSFEASRSGPLARVTKGLAALSRSGRREARSAEPKVPMSPRSVRPLLSSESSRPGEEPSPHVSLAAPQGTVASQGAARTEDTAKVTAPAAPRPSARLSAPAQTVPPKPAPRGSADPKKGPSALSEVTAPPRAQGGVRRISSKGIVPPPAGAAPSADPSMGEAESLTVFGARRQRSEAKSGPRFLGLSMTLGLLGVMGLVALWSLWFSEADPSSSVSSAQAEDPSLSSPLEQAIERAVEEAAAPDAQSGLQQDSGIAALPEETVPDAPVGPSEDAPRVEAEQRSATPAVEDTASTEARAISEESSTELNEAATAVTAPQSAGAEPFAIPGAPQATGSAVPAEAEEVPAQANLAAVEEESTSEAVGPQANLPPTRGNASSGTAAEETAEQDRVVPAVEPTVSSTLTTVPAATGSLPEGLTELRLAAIDPTRPRLDARDLPETTRRDVRPVTPDNPLPLGTVLGPDGLAIPTAEGALTPEGYTVYSGAPPIIPPVRAEPIAETPAVPETGEVAPTDVEPLPEASALPSDETLPAVPDPLSDFRPRARPEDLTGLGTGDGPVSDTALLLRPRSRPEEIDVALAVPEILPPAAEEPFDQAKATDANDTPGDLTEAEDPASAASATGSRPRTRPDLIAARAEAFRTEEVRLAAIAEAEAQAAAEAIAAAEAERQAALASATRLAVAASPAPRIRPQSVTQAAARFAASAAEAERQAEARQAAASAAPAQPAAAAPEERQSGAAPARTQVAAASAAAVATPTPRPPRGPAVARNQRIQPSVPSNARVARQATQRNALRMNDVTLIGVYGSPSQRRALVRLPSGRYVKVQVGDRMDGGQVAAISQNEVRYVKRGRSVVLRMPSG